MSDTIDRRLLLQAALAIPAFGALIGTAQAASAAEPLVVMATLTAKPDKADALRELITPFAAEARTEPGCLHYTLLEDTKTPGAFFTYEVWSGPEALAAHMKTDTIKAFGGKLADILAKPPTQTTLKTISAS